MRNNNGPLPALVVAALVVAALATIVAKEGWVIWIPVLIGLAVIGKLWVTLSR